MKKLQKIQIGIWVEIIITIIVLGVFAGRNYMYKRTVPTMQGDYIKWVDFNVSSEALNKAYDWDVKTYGKKPHINWITLLAYEAAKTGGTFDDKAVSDMENCAKQMVAGKFDLEKQAKELKYYPYYKEAYGAVLNGFVGEYKIETQKKDGSVSYEKKYGLKAFSPIAKGFEYRDYDDFGVSRSYGFKREHLGHDMMGQIGTPVIATESGYIEALGWNQYGGWRIGIRSYDKKRYYYYAHLRQNYPYQKNLKVGSKVMAGDVIGYMGHTGYSTTENTNNIDEVHLHFGLQLIFDESQKDGNNEIWINCYELTKFLSKNRSEVRKVEGTKEWERCFDMKEMPAKTKNPKKPGNSNF